MVESCWEPAGNTDSNSARFEARQATVVSGGILWQAVRSDKSLVAFRWSRGISGPKAQPFVPPRAAPSLLYTIHHRPHPPCVDGESGWVAKTEPASNEDPTRAPGW